MLLAVIGYGNLFFYSAIKPVNVESLLCFTYIKQHRLLNDLRESIQMTNISLPSKEQGQPHGYRGPCVG